MFIDGMVASGAVNYVNDHDVTRVDVGGPSATVAGITAPFTIGWAEGQGFVDGFPPAGVAVLECDPETQTPFQAWGQTSGA
jgi:hypothetical protein